MGLLLPVVIAGCAQTAPPPLLEPQAGARRWPPPPAQPRVRFLGTISSDKDLHAPTNLWQRIVGDEPNRKLVAPTDVAVSTEGVLFVIDQDLGRGRPSSEPDAW